MSRPEEAFRIMRNNNSFLFQANKSKGCLFAKADTVLTALPTSTTCFSPTLPILWPSWSSFRFFKKPRLFWLRTCSNAVPATWISLLYILNLASSISSFKSWFSWSFMLGPVLRLVGGSPTTSHHQLFVLLALFVSFHDLYTICIYFISFYTESIDNWGWVVSTGRDLYVKRASLKWLTGRFATFQIDGDWLGRKGEDNGEGDSTVGSILSLICFLRVFSYNIVIGGTQATFCFLSEWGFLSLFFWLAGLLSVYP